MARGPARLVSGHASVGQRQSPRRSRGPGDPVSDHGLTVGDGVFEAVKVVDDQPFALTLHLERLARSAAGLGLPEVDEGLVRKGVEAVLGRGRAAARAAADHVHRRAGAAGVRTR